MPDKKRIALLIDCDNVSHNSIEGVLEELAKYGMVNVRHAHGDWNNQSLSGWADKLHPNKKGNKFVAKRILVELKKALKASAKK